MILAGDVGGTKTVVALYEARAGGLAPVREARFASADFGALEDILARFLRESPGARIDAACFGIAGPVIDGRAQTTNLPWKLDERDLERAVGARRVKLLNDLEAAAYGMLELRQDERAVLNPGRAASRPGNAAVVAAGTGLGEAMLVWDGERHRAVASEGGHADWAPRTDEEIELLLFLRAEFGRVSTERVLAGPGLHNIYRFLRRKSAEAEPDWLRERIAGGDPSAVVSQTGLEGRDPVCARTLEMFAAIYGAEAGNVALQCVATQVFIGGGIAPKILPALQSRAFLDAFADKGRFRDLLAGIPVAVSLNPRTPLVGAATYATRL